MRLVCLLVLLAGCSASTKCIILRTEQDLRNTQQPESKLGACVCKINDTYWRWVNASECEWSLNVPEVLQHNDVHSAGEVGGTESLPSNPGDDTLSGSLH
jgi:hypothetical protein